MNAIVTNIALESAKHKFASNPNTVGTWTDFIIGGRMAQKNAPASRAEFKLFCAQWGNGWGFTEAEVDAIADEVGVPADNGVPPREELVRALKLDAVLDKIARAIVR